jgi:hypothetical protein
MSDDLIADPSADPEDLFVARLAVSDQHLARVNGQPWNRQAKHLYWANGQPKPGRCRVCLRIFDATPQPGGRPPTYCSAACRARFADTRRRALPRQWRSCAWCGADFLCLDVSGLGGAAEGLVTCPPPTPSPYWKRAADSARSECAERRQADLNRQSCARYRARSKSNQVTAHGR